MCPPSPPCTDPRHRSLWAITRTAPLPKPESPSSSQITDKGLLMAHLNRRQRIAAGVTALVLVGSGTAAFAYWTSTGSGSGTGSTTAGASNLSITGDVATALYPGQAAQGFTATVKNLADNNAQVAGLTAYVT